MKAGTIGGALLGAAGFLPPVALGLVVGGTLVFMLHRWRQIHDLRLMLEEFQRLEQIDVDTIDDDW
jgi:hypothetical protein